MSKFMDLKNHIKSSLNKYLIKLEIQDEIIYLSCKKENLIEIINFIKNDKYCYFSQLIDITAVDYINNKERFELIYILLSHQFNTRIIIKTKLNENENIPSICDIFQSANWYERECYDLFGIIFEKHPDLRRIMTDYNFEGHPLRKDFPLTGHNEVRYDDSEKKVIYDKVKLSQEYRNFDYSSPWEGLENQLIGDEKSKKED